LTTGNGGKGEGRGTAGPRDGDRLTLHIGGGCADGICVLGHGLSQEGQGDKQIDEHGGQI